MRLLVRFIVVASSLLVPAFCSGQDLLTANRTLLARLSFESSWIQEPGSEASPRVCFSVDLDGQYRMRRLAMLRQLTMQGDNKILLETPHMETLQGVLAPKELKKLQQLLEDPAFRSLKRSSGGLLRKGADTFVAEVPRENRVQRVVWSDTDGENPFPPSASRVVRWLQSFKAEGAEPLDVSAEDVCPSGALQPVDPATALLQPIR